MGCGDPGRFGGVHIRRKLRRCARGDQHVLIPACAVVGVAERFTAGSYLAFSSLTAVALLSACGADTGNSAGMSPSRTSTTKAAAAVTTTTAVAAPPTTQRPRTEKWIDLEAGDCLADLPPSDPSMLTVTIVDCATRHRAEVYFRAPMADTPAFADVANQKCAAGFSQYTGQSVDGSPFTVTYLIDSNQDRTASNPAPSTVICLLQAANGRPLTESARRGRTNRPY
jgi:hypothetical protein